MTLRLSWAEISKITSEHVAKSGLNLGPPRVLGPAPYGPEEIEIEASAFEFPIITEPPAQEYRMQPELLIPATPDPLDVPF